MQYSNDILKKLHHVQLEILKDFIILCDENNLSWFAIAGTALGTVRHHGYIPWDDDIDIGLPRVDYEKVISLLKEQYSDKYELINPDINSEFSAVATRIMMKGTIFQEWSSKDLNYQQGIAVDIHPFDHVPDDEKSLKKQARSAWFWAHLLILRHIPKPALGFYGFKRKIISFLCIVIHYFLAFFHISHKWIYNRCNQTIQKYNNTNTKRIAFLCGTHMYTSVIEPFPLVKMPFEDIEINLPKDYDRMLQAYYGDYMQLPPLNKRVNHYPYRLQFKNEPIIIEGNTQHENSIP